MFLSTFAKIYLVGVREPSTKCHYPLYQLDEHFIYHIKNNLKKLSQIIQQIIVSQRRQSRVFTEQHLKIWFPSQYKICWCYRSMLTTRCKQVHLL